MAHARSAVQGGSSPRMRGTQPSVSCSKMAPGIIPAYAGNTWPHTGGRLSRRDHPRVCGEHECVNFLPREFEGSSPRMRGTLSVPSTCGMGGGIIPAYAGNTSSASSSNVYSWDHPRVCGEHAIILSYRNCLRGSSPRMRGTHRRRTVPAPRPGIIPAYAGNTPARPGQHPARRDHPRVCGEHWLTVISWKPSTGSSPRMRGTPAGHAHHLHA